MTKDNFILIYNNKNNIMKTYQTISNKPSLNHKISNIWYKTENIILLYKTVIWQIDFVQHHIL